MMASGDLFQFYMERFYVIPKDVKNDIVYCQRSMRAYLKVHQLVADVFKKQGDADPVQKQRILDELEDEIEEINAEQQFLLLQLNESLEKFYKLLRHNGIEAVPSFTNKVISSNIVPFVVDVKYIVYPTNVKVRLTEEELIRKHFLLAPDDQPSAPQMPATSLTTCPSSVMYVGNVSDEDDIAVASNDVTSSETNLVYLSTIQQPEDVTLALLDNSESMFQKVKQVLKIGQCGDVSNADSIDVKPDLSDTVVTVSDDDDYNEDVNTEPTQKMDDTVGGAVEQLAPKLESILTLEPSLKPEIIMNTKPAIIESESLSKSELMQKPDAKIQPTAETVQDQTESSKIAESRMNLRQALKRARKTKQQPRVFDEDENVMTELISEKSEPTQPKAESMPLQSIVYQSEPPPLIPIRQSKTINSTKSSSNGSVSVAAAARKEAKETKAMENDKKVAIEKKPPLQVKQYKTRKLYAKNNNANNNGSSVTTGNGSSVAVAANTSGEATTSSSDDSNSEQRPVIRWHPDEPREYRTRPEEYGQEGFLGLLSLYTPAVLSQLQQRRSKRKRRTIHTTERSDFHYGRLEVPQLLQTEVSKKKKKVKTEFLLSPKVKRLQAKKGGSKRSSPEKFEEVSVPVANHTQKFNYISVGRRTRTPPNSPDAKLKCKECRKKTEPLFPCSVCDFLFHQECHEDQGKPNRHIKCPMCLSDEKMKKLSKNGFVRHNSNDLKKGESAANSTVNGRK